MTLFERLHFLHRAWRLRFIAEKFGVGFLLDRDLAGKTAIDIGANRGVYSYWMHKKVGPRGFVIAFEPQPELGSYLREAKHDFRLTQLEIANVALSSVTGETELLRPRHHWGGASMAWHPKGELDILKVKAVTLDEYFQNHEARPISFIKCDVEGHEYHVFKGGEQILQEDRPELLFECGFARDPECEAFSYLNGLEYDGFCFYKQGFAPIAKYNLLHDSLHRRALVDFVFVPKEKSHALTRYDT
ncbi:MAG: FkbM family methyltransferase [Acidiferrobacterales bacterium]